MKNVKPQRVYVEIFMALSIKSVLTVTNGHEATVAHIDEN